MTRLSVLVFALFLQCMLHCSGFFRPVSRKTLSPLSFDFILKNLMPSMPGNIYVNDKCIDCDACRWISPSTFARYPASMATYVIKQPMTPAEKIRAFSAMHSCPTNAIQMFQADPYATLAETRFPLEINEDIPGVHHCGFHSVESYGATPYIIYRGNGNVMIDCPRYDSRLADTIEKEGGISSMIITHKDNLADHKKWKERFPDMERIIHLCDVQEGWRDIEVKLEGFGVWHPDTDIDIIYTPGHTAGSLCVLYRSAVDPVLFSGDHLSYSAARKRLTGWKSKATGNVDAQLMYIRELATDAYQYRWILPAHGRMMHFQSIEEKNDALLAAAEIFKYEDPRDGMLDIGHA